MQPATRKLPAGFEACDKVTAHGDGEFMDLPAVRQLPGLKMTRRLNWAVCALHCGDEELGSTAGVFDLLWAALGASGQRNLSVRQGVDGKFSALVFKGDQAEPDLGAIAQRVKVTSLSEIAKPGQRSERQRIHCQVCAGMVRHRPGAHFKLPLPAVGRAGGRSPGGLRESHADG